MATLEEHFVLYLDFLGTREAIANPEQAEALLQLLLGLAELRKEASVSMRTLGSIDVPIWEFATSTFSDNVVLSFPPNLMPRTPVTDGVVPLFILSKTSWIVARVAAQALSLGFLIRGGATIGPLYHSGDVVFGEALVEAYHLESKIARYPRVVISPKLAAWVDDGARRALLRQGEDGLFELDYFRLLLESVVVGSPLGSIGKRVSVSSWFDQIAALLHERLADLGKGEKIPEYSKWAWFVHRFRQILEGLPEEGHGRPGRAWARKLPAL